MFLAVQLTVLAVVGAAFALLLTAYRKPDAVENSFLCSVLLMAGGCIEPDLLLFIPVFWWGFSRLWADNLRVYLASLCGILLVALYAAIIWFFLPECNACLWVLSRFDAALNRSFCFDDGQFIPSLTALIIAGVSAVAGIWVLMAHMVRFGRANINIRAYVGVAVPFFLLSLLSTLFPDAHGHSLLPLLVGFTAYLMGVYLYAYGMPRVKLPQRRSSPRRRKWKRAPSRYN